MRTGRRKAWGILMGAMAVVVVATLSLAAAPAGPKRDADENPVRLTLEVSWSPHELPKLPDRDDVGQGGSEVVTLELSEGRVLDAVAVAGGFGGGAAAEPGPVSGGRPIWRLGTGVNGRARVRVEAVPSASLYVTAGGQRTQFSLAALFDGAQRTLPQFPVVVCVKRLEWDPLEVRVQEGEGPAPPGSRVPVTVGFNILSAETEQVTLHYRAELRPFGGGEAVWRYPGGSEQVTTNGAAPPLRRLDVALPVEEGTYVLEIQASWEQAGSHEGTRLTRWLRRKRPGVSGAATRRVTFVVVAAAPARKPDESERGGTARERVVDAVDLGRGRAKHAVGSGRSPAPPLGRRDWPVPVATLAAPGLRDRLRDWIGRDDVATLGPSGPAGIAWVASELKVERPGRPHRLRVTITGGDPEALGVALLAPARNDDDAARLFLDALVSGPAVDDPSTPTVRSWLVWPDADRPVVVLGNRSERSSVRVGSIELVEVRDPASAESTEAAAPGTRGLALDLTGPQALKRFGGEADGLPGVDTVARTRNLASYASACGATAVVLPDRLSDRSARARLDGQVEQDGTGPDPLNLMLRLLAARGLAAWVELDLSGPLPGLPAPEAPEARAQALVRIDASGAVDGPAYQVLHPQVKGAVTRRLEEAIRPRLVHSNLLGVVIRMGAGPTILGGPDTGLDDRTYAAFVRENFPADEANRVPARDGADAGRYAARAQFVSTAARAAWLDWRADKLGAAYAEWAGAVQAAAPGALLGVVTPGVDEGPAGAAARRAEREGRPPDVAWREIGVDLKRWPAAGAALVVFRGSSIAPESLAHDVASSPELDEQVAPVPLRGVWLDSGRPAVVAGPLRLLAPPELGDEPLGHALAASDPRWIVITAEAVAGQEERLARFARLFRALPASNAASPTAPRLASGVAVRSWQAQGRTFISLANDSPYEVLQTCYVRSAPGAVVDDLGRGVRLRPRETNEGSQELVLRLAPFGVAAVRIGASEARVEPGPSHLPDLDKLEAQAEGLVARLGRLNKPDSLIGPPSPGFEPVEAGTRPAAPPLAEIRSPDAAAVAAAPGAPAGWSAYGDPANTVALDSARPHAGTTALRLDAKAVPALVGSDAFLPPGGAALIIHTWLRADRDANVRVWVETESGGVVSARAAEVPVTTAWTERLVRVPGLPPGGLDSLRLRYEWLGPTPGLLWLDDVSVVGQGPSEPGRRTQRVLLDALQAFRARRYADFARLLGSHRARTATQRLLSGESPEVLRTGQAADSDLPPERRLR